MNLNFDTPLDLAGKRRIVQKTTVPVVTTSATVTALPPDTVIEPIAKASDQSSYLARDVDNWTWQDVRDYVVNSIEQRFGTFPRDLLKESGIFKSFATRWGTKAGPIAKAAFEVHDGMWRGAPISVTRFTIKSDPYFAALIADRL